MLVFFYVALVGGMREKSATFDETGHGAAGVSYWKLNDYRLDPEGGQLPKRWISLPLWLGNFTFPEDSQGWAFASNFTTGDEFFHRRGNDTLLMLELGRGASAVLTVALGLAVWLWTRFLFGAPAGLLSLLLFVLSPPILANGALLKDDIASALMLLCATTAFWAMLRHFTPFRIALSAATTGLLFVTKFSAVILLPVAGLLFVLCCVKDKILPSAALRRGALILVTQAAATWVIVWAMFGLRFEAIHPLQGPATSFPQMWEWVYDRPHQSELLRQLDLTVSQQAKADLILDRWNARLERWIPQTAGALTEIGTDVLTLPQRRQLDALRAAPPEKLFPRLVYYGLKHRALPEAYLFGLVHVWRTSREKPAFLNGEISATGWRSYLPFVFAIKTPWLFLLLAAAAVAVALRRASQLWDFVPLLALFAVYWAVAITGNINIGQRHLLPIYPPLYILTGILVSPLVAGLALPRWLQRSGPWLVGGSVAVLAVEAVHWFPHHLSYFNGFIFPARAYRHVVDSSLDWGQDLPAVRRYLDHSPPRGPVYLAYFGAGDPGTYGIKARPIYAAFDYDAYHFPAATFQPQLDSQRNPAELQRWLAQHPRYDPNFVLNVPSTTGPSSLFVQRPADLRLTGGTYFISATLLQPLNPASFGPWNDTREASYRSLAEPFLWLASDDSANRLKGVRALIDRQALPHYPLFRQLRFERLASYLRAREPHETLHGSILVYHLTDAEVATALEGPTPTR